MFWKKKVCLKSLNELYVRFIILKTEVLFVNIVECKMFAPIGGKMLFNYCSCSYCIVLVLTIECR